MPLASRGPALALPCLPLALFPSLTLGRNCTICCASRSTLLPAANAVTSYRSGRSAQMSSVCVPMEPVDPSSEILRCVYLVWGRCVRKRRDRSIEPSIDRFGYKSPTAAAFMLLGAPQCLRDAPTHLLVLSKCQVGRLLERLDRVHCRGGGEGSGAGQLQIS